MALEIAKDRIRLSQIVEEKQEVLSIDGDVIVNDVKPDVLKVINTTGTVCVYKKEVLNGKVKLEGCINTYIIYLADDAGNSIRTVNTSLDFAEIIDLENCKEGMTLDVNLYLKGFETKVINGRKLHVRAFLDMTLKIHKLSEIEAIVDIRNDNGDIQMLNCNKKVLSLIGENTGKTTLKETINTGDEMAEIMKVNFQICNVTTKTSYNKVIIKANANIKIMYLTEDNMVNEITSDFPIMGFIDMPDVTENSKCISQVSLKNLVLRQNDDEENSIYVEADMDLLCRAFEEKEVNVLQDIYSISNDVNLERKSIRAIQEEFELTDTINVTQKLTNPELIYGKILGANLNPILNSVNIKDGKISYEAVLTAEFIVQNENDVNNVKMEIPFDFELTDNKITKTSNIETEINLVSQKIDIEDNNIVVINAQMEVYTGVQNDDTISFTQNIELVEPENLDTYSMVIYFVKPGDTLWEIAKQFRSKVQDIARVNNIEDENKIYVGQQLYIPKFIGSQIA